MMGQFLLWAEAQKPRTKYEQTVADFKQAYIICSSFHQEGVYFFTFWNVGGTVTYSDEQNVAGVAVCDLWASRKLKGFHSCPLEMLFPWEQAQAFWRGHVVRSTASELMWVWLSLITKGHRSESRRNQPKDTQLNSDQITHAQNVRQQQQQQQRLLFLTTKFGFDLLHSNRSQIPQMKSTKL